MRQLVLTLKGNRFINQSIFEPHLYIYEDILIYHHRKHFVLVDEITINYNHIVKVNLHKGIFFSILDIIVAGNNPLEFKGVQNKTAKKAKNIIDQKIYQVHNKHLSNTNATPYASKEMDNFELSVRRLQELYNKGKISEKEYQKKRRQLLKRIT